MRVFFAFAVSLIFIINYSHSQTPANDWGVRDTLALAVSMPPLPGVRSSVVIECWLYSDDTVVSYSVGFTWDNPKMRIDSATASPIIGGTEDQAFLLSNDDLMTSNLNRTFVLAGFSSGPGIPGDNNSRRLWATYYFSVENWYNTDTISINVLPDSQIEFGFVSPGPFYPVKYRPFFDGPMLFPGMATLLDESENDIILPDAVTLYQNYPNPFNPETIIEFEIKRRCQAQLEIFNSLGQHVTTLVNWEHSAGEFKYSWNALNEFGAKVPSGVYFYRLITPDMVLTKKMTLLK